MKSIKLNLNKSISLDKFCKKYKLTEYNYPWVFNYFDLFDTLKLNNVVLDEDTIINMINDGCLSILYYYRVREEVIENILDNNLKLIFSSLEIILILSKQEVSFDYMINKHNDRGLWSLFSRTQPIILQKFEEVKDYVDLDMLCRSLPIDRNFIDKYFELIDWYGVSMNPLIKLTDQDIIDFSNKLNFKVLSNCNNLSEEIIEKFQDRVGWSGISQNSVLSEEFILKHKNKLVWNILLSCQRGRDIFKKEELKKYYNPLASYDLRRDDWFVGYVSLLNTLPNRGGFSNKRLKLIMPTNNIWLSKKDFPCYVDKCKIYYKDLITPSIINGEMCSVIKRYNRFDNFNKR